MITERIESPYYTDKVARCQINRAMQEAVKLRTMIGTGQLMEQPGKEKSLLNKERGFHLIKGKYIPKKHYKGKSKDEIVAMEKEWCFDMEYRMYDKFEHYDEEFINDLQSNMTD